MPGDVAAEAASRVYSIFESGSNLTASDAAYGLFRAASRKVDEWEHQGGYGYLLELLGGIDVISSDGEGNQESPGSVDHFPSF